MTAASLSEAGIVPVLREELMISLTHDFSMSVEIAGRQFLMWYDGMVSIKIYLA